MTSSNTNPELSPLVQKFIEEVTRKYSPKFVVRNKAHKEGLYAVASFFAKIFNKKIDTDFVTQTLHECWVAPMFLAYRDADLIMILAHETMHERDRKAWSTFAVFLLYFMPQLLAVFALLSLVAIGGNLAWLWCLGFLLFLLPIPSPGRAWIELRAYRVNMLILRHVHKYSEETIRAFADSRAKSFTGMSYYLMWPFKKHIVGLLLKEVPHPFYDELKAWIVANNLTP